MFREIRRSDRKIETIEAIEILKKCKYGILSTVSDDGYAYGVPLSYVYMDNNIYFHCAIEGHKLDNIKKNNKVSFCVVGDVETIPEKFTTKYESVIVFGEAAEVYGDEKNKALIGFLEKYSNQYVNEGKEYIKKAYCRTKVIKISIDHITGKARK